MNYTYSKTGLAVLTAATLLFGSCKRIETPAPIGDAGQTIVKIIDVDKKLINLDLLTTPQILRMIEVQRLVANSRELSGAMTVVVKDDPGAVADYNNANGTSFVPIPANLYNVDPSSPRIGTNYSLTFNAGEFAKEIKFVIPNALAIDLTQSYAFGFSLVSADGNGHVAKTEKKIVVEIGVKNKYDGIYNLHGYVTRETAPGVLDPSLSGAFGPVEVSMASTSSNQNAMNFHPWANGSGSQFAPTVVPVYTVNTVTNAVETSSSGGAFPGGIANASGYSSRYDPAAKTFYVKYTWASAGLPRVCTDTLNYLRSR